LSGQLATTSAGWEARNYANFVRYLTAIAAGHRDSRLLRRDGVVAALAPATPGRSIFNSVAYEEGAALEAVIDELGETYAEAGVHAWSVWVPEPDRTMGRLLAGRGHKPDGAPRAMLCELDAIPDMDAEIELSRRAPWGTVCAINDAAWGYPEGSFEHGMGARPDAAIRAYGARYAGFVAAGLATVTEGEDCCVYLVATLPEARGKGLAGRLLQRALLDARERGARTSTLQSSPMGIGVYRRLGYRDVGGLGLWEHRTAAAD
jgi:GNAT superfamily N-acetyltransferase